MGCFHLPGSFKETSIRDKVPDPEVNRRELATILKCREKEVKEKKISNMFTL